MTRRQAIRLKPLLPKGYLALAQERLAKKGLKYSQGHISRVKSAQDENEAIEEVLFRLAAEEKQRRAKREALLDQLI